MRRNGDDRKPEDWPTRIDGWRCWCRSVWSPSVRGGWSRPNVRLYRVIYQEPAGGQRTFGEAPMKYRVRFRFGILALVVTVLCPQSIAQNASSDATTFYAANTRPPDAFLALRTNLTIGFGHRIATMANGTPMKC